LHERGPFVATSAATFSVATLDTERTHETPTVEPEATPVEHASSPTPTCSYCGGRPCVGPDHHAYPILHYNDPAEERRRDAVATQTMLKMMRYGNPY
jgi:hypothetical protein